jgi:hypothetical protein
LLKKGEQLHCDQSNVVSNEYRIIWDRRQFISQCLTFLVPATTSRRICSFYSIPLGGVRDPSLPAVQLLPVTCTLRLHFTHHWHSGPFPFQGTLTRPVDLISWRILSLKLSFWHWSYDGSVNEDFDARSKTDDGNPFKSDSRQSLIEIALR